MVVPNYMLVKFFRLGFVTQAAFFNICKEMNHYISQKELYLFWEFGLVCEGMEDFLNEVIETLKNE